MCVSVALESNDSDETLRRHGFAQPVSAAVSVGPDVIHQITTSVDRLNLTKLGRKHASGSVFPRALKGFGKREARARKLQHAAHPQRLADENMPALLLSHEWTYCPRYRQIKAHNEISNQTGLYGIAIACQIPRASAFPPWGGLGALERIAVTTRSFRKAEESALKLVFPDCRN